MKDGLPASLGGITHRFSGNGRKLGYPTANIDSDTNLKDGVYFGYAGLSQYQDRPALIFIGTPTTVGDKKRRVEAYLLDIPDVDYYGEKLAIKVKKFWRQNKKFASVDELIKAMHADEIVAREWFANRPSH